MVDPLFTSESVVCICYHAYNKHVTDVKKYQSIRNNPQ